jgi:leader peptidase (prepilin peptidase) / N-methyltransferase
MELYPDYFSVLYAASFFVLGTIIGSFLNVVVARIGTGEGFLGRSHCPKCMHTLVWRELVPIISFCIQRGRCIECGKPISFQYPFVEIVTGLVFVLVYSVFGLDGTLFGAGEVALYLVLSSILIAILFYDLKHLIIPNPLVYLFTVLSFTALFVNFDAGVFVLPSFYALVAGPLLFLPFFSLWFFSGGRWMGLGDGKLALGMGFSLGLFGGVSALLWAFWIGAVVALALMVTGRTMSVVSERYSLPFLNTSLTMKSEIPFCPFLILGWALVAFFGIEIDAFVDALSYIMLS